MPQQQVVRVQSEIPGFEACYIEVAGGWTVRELNAIFESRDGWLDLWRRKVVACRVDTADGEVLTDPQQVVSERFEDLDVAVARFVNTSLQAAVDYLATLGGARRRVSSGGDSPRTTTRTPAT